MNLFIDIKNKLFIMLESDLSMYTRCLTEIMEVLQTTLDKIENIYYKYFLFPKLQARIIKNVI